jgi:hypothetical protein
MAGILFSDTIKTITYQEILPTLIDQYNNSNSFTGMVLSNTKEWSGITLNIPVETANSTTGGFFTGFETFPTAATNNVRTLTYYLAAYEQSIAIPGIERDVNANSEKQVLGLLTARMDEAKISGLANIGQALQGTGLGAAFDGLGLIVDNGSVTAAYGGVTRSSSPYINADVTPVTNGILSLDYLSTEYDNVSAVGAVSESPTLGYTDKATWTYLETLMQPMLQARYDVVGVDGYDRVSGGVPKGSAVRPGDRKLGFSAGARTLEYRATPIIADDMATAGQFLYLNLNYLDFYNLKTPGLKTVDSNIQIQKGYYMNVDFPAVWNFREMMSPVNQYGEMGMLILMGNLVCSQPRRQGKLTGILSNF